MKLKTGMIFNVIGENIKMELLDCDSSKHIWTADVVEIIHNIPTHKYYSILESTILENVILGFYEQED